MNRYILFAFDNYYPAGGSGDIQGVYTTLETADMAFDLLSNGYDLNGSERGFQYVELYDIETDDVVKNSR